MSISLEFHRWLQRRFWKIVREMEKRTIRFSAVSSNGSLLRWCLGILEGTSGGQTPSLTIDPERLSVT